MAREVAQQDQPNQSADKRYYASRQGTSAIQRSIADSTLKRGQPLRANPTPKIVDPKQAYDRSLPRSSDVYYASQPNASRPVAPATVPQPVEQIADEQQLRLLSVRSIDDLRSVVSSAVGAAREGYRVQLRLGEAAWATRARTQIELAVAREDISEEQGREIVLGVLPAAVVRPAVFKDSAVPLPTVRLPVPAEINPPSPETVVARDGAGDESDEELEDGTDIVPDDDEDDEDDAEDVD